LREAKEGGSLVGIGSFKGYRGRRTGVIHTRGIQRRLLTRSSPEKKGQSRRENDPDRSDIRQNARTRKKRI